jgi:Zn-dependent protease with chaperone function
VRSLLGSVAEEFFYLNNIAASVLVGEKQLPDLHNLLLEACRILDLEPPQLYIQQNPVPNAYNFAMRGKKPFMVMHTSLIEMLTPAEIQAVMAHELGHLKCEHGVYLTLANIMVLAAGLLPNWGTMLAQSLQQRMLAWVRCAEFSCDRAALLAVQDPKIVTFIKFRGFYRSGQVLRCRQRLGNWRNVKGFANPTVNTSPPRPARARNRSLGQFPRLSKFVKRAKNGL